MQRSAGSAGFTAEIKFVVDAAIGAQIRDWARGRLAADPYGGGTCADEYRVSSLYFDTEARDVFHRRGSYGRSKYRIRRYHQEPRAFLERKLRTGSRLSKRRTNIEIAMLPLLAQDGALNGDATAWFRRRVAVRRLQPVCQVSYIRTARVGDTVDGPARLTIDQDLQAVASDAFTFDAKPATPLLQGEMIVELKYRASLPAVFKLLVEEFALRSQRASKYRVAADSLGLIVAAPEDEAPSAIHA
jgi:hypothetical protein